MKQQNLRTYRYVAKIKKKKLQSAVENDKGLLTAAVGYSFRMPYPRPGMPPGSMPPSSTATTTAQQQKGPVIGPQVPNTKPLFPAAQVSFFFVLQGLSAFFPTNSKYMYNACSLMYFAAYQF